MSLGSRRQTIRMHCGNSDAASSRTWIKFGSFKTNTEVATNARNDIGNVASQNRTEKAAKFMLRWIEEICLVAKLLGALIRRQYVTEDVGLR